MERIKRFNIILGLLCCAAFSPAPSHSFTPYKCRVYNNVIYAVHYMGSQQCRLFATSDTFRTWQPVTDVLGPIGQHFYTNNGINDYLIIGDTLYIARGDGVYSTNLNNINFNKITDAVNDSAYLNIIHIGGQMYVFAYNGLYQRATATGYWSLVRGIQSKSTYRYAVAGSAIIDSTFFILSFDSLYRSYDRGGAWATVSPLDSNLALLCYIESMGRRLFMGEYSGGIYYSDDLGASWTPSRPGCDVCSAPQLFCMEAFDGVLAASVYGASNSHYVLSRDSGVTWEAGSPTLTRFFNDAIQYGSRYYAITDSGVFVSQDTCRTWLFYHENPAISAETAGGPVPELGAYPNPFNSSVSIGFPPNINPGRVDIFSVDGRRMAAMDASRKSVVRWDAAGFSPGVYIVRVTGEKGTAEKRILLIK